MSNRPFSRQPGRAASRSASVLNEGPQTPLGTAEHFTLTPHALATGGEAIARTADGMAVFIPGAAPGDVVEVAVTEQKKGYARSQLVKVVSWGEHRVEPPCAMASPERCGGCPLMHVAPATQLQEKQQWVERALRHTGAQILPIEAPAPALGYRVRARLTQRSGQLGFSTTKSNQSVQLTDCPVMQPLLARVLLQQTQAVAPYLGEGAMVAGLQGSFAGQAAVHLAVRLGLGGDPEAVWDWLQQLLSDGVIVGAVLDDQRLGEPAIDIGAPGSTLWAAADGFAQACEAGHTRLPALVADAALGLLTNQPEASSQTPPLSHLTELYAGSGNLTRALRPLTRKLLAVEGDADATQRLRRLLQEPTPLNQTLATVEIAQLPVEQALRKYIHAGLRTDVVVLDPPRDGAKAALPLLMQLAPRRIVYVSCDAMTLGRDLVALRELGMRPHTVLPLDLMPHTAQVECVAVLERA